MQRLLVNVIAHMSWETDDTTKDLLQTRFPKIIEKGDAERATAKEVLKTLSLDLAPETLVVITGGPPCVDHSRVKGARARGHRGREGRKLLALARLISQLREQSPWEIVFLVEHVIPTQRQTIDAVDRVLGTEAFVCDAADLGVIRRPRLWWTDAPLDGNLIWERQDDMDRCRRNQVQATQGRVTGTTPLALFDKRGR